MKTIFIAALLFVGVVSNNFAQKVDFSACLASSGGVHTSTPSVVDKHGNIFVAGGTREGLNVTNDAFQKSYQGHTEKDVTGGDAFLMKLSPDGPWHQKTSPRPKMPCIHQSAGEWIWLY